MSEPLVFIHDGVGKLIKVESGMLPAQYILLIKTKGQELTGFGFTVIPRFMAPLHSEGLHII